MNHLNDIRRQHIALSANRYALELLEELQKCADALGPDSPRGQSAQALIDKVWEPVHENKARPVKTGPVRSIQPDGSVVHTDGEGNVTKVEAPAAA